MTARPAGTRYRRGMSRLSIYVWDRGPGGGAPWRWHIDAWADDGNGGQLHGGSTTKIGALRAAAAKLLELKRRDD